MTYMIMVCETDAAFRDCGFRTKVNTQIGPT